MGHCDGSAKEPRQDGVIYRCTKCDARFIKKSLIDGNLIPVHYEVKR